MQKCRSKEIQKATSMQPKAYSLGFRPQDYETKGLREQRTRKGPGEQRTKGTGPRDQETRKTRE